MRAFIASRARAVRSPSIGVRLLRRHRQLADHPDPVIVTDTFSGTLNINGAATHNVFTSATGTVTATLTSLGDNAAGEDRFQHGHAGPAPRRARCVLANDNAVVTSERDRHGVDAGRQPVRQGLRRRRADRAGLLHLHGQPPLGSG